MKNLMFTLIALLVLNTYAQEPKHDKRKNHSSAQEDRPEFTPEQKATLYTKKLTLHLDLKETQQVAVQKLLLKQIASRTDKSEQKEARKDLTNTERFELKSKRMDEKIAFKSEMKSILTAEQFEKWEKRDSRRKKSRLEHKNKRKMDRR